MGVYLNPGYQSFEEAINSSVFIDKTEMIFYLNSITSTEQKYVSVSRPRRFGKTMAANMICAYYGKDNSEELFKKTKLSEHKNWDKYLGKFDVLRLVITDFLGESEGIADMIAYLSDEVTAELMEAYPDINYGKRINLRTVMSKIYDKKGTRFVIVIDEWDAIFRECKNDRAGQTKYLDFLRGWLKGKNYVALAYMTGILPIKKYGKHSALNMFFEYSIISPMQLAPYTGFTVDEVAELCKEYGRDFDAIRDWYDGYEVSDIIPPDPDHKVLVQTGKAPEAVRYSLYSPLSVVNAVTTGFILNYWNKTESYEALSDYIAMNQDGLKDAVVILMDGGRIRIDTSSYQNDMTTFHSRDDVLTLLIHLGYLGYDIDTREVFIPNNEILDEFKTSTKGNEWINSFESFKLSQRLLDATWNADEDKVAELLELAHDRASNKTYNSEAALSYAIQYAYYAAQKYYTTIQELDTGKGYADLVYLPAPGFSDKPVLLIELKYDKTIKTAVDQIKERNYPQLLEHYKGNILLISVNYDKDIDADSVHFKHHNCKIEKA